MVRVPVAVLGSTGIVGQRLVRLLENHPWFEVSALAASSRSTGKRYGEAVKWYIEGSVPESVADTTIVPVDVEAVRRVGNARLVFSALPSSVAAEVEPKFSRAGFPVVSDASAFRMEEDVPVLIPEVNPEHLRLLGVQKERRGWSGFIVTNPNCTANILTLSLKPILDAYGIRRVVVTSLQAISGAGYDGLPSMAIQDNVIPYISREEEKVEAETLKMLGEVSAQGVRNVSFRLSASCNRVLVYDGHTEVVHVETQSKAGPAEIAQTLREFRSRPQELRLPSAPPNPIVVRCEEDRPQPRLDRDAGRGMAVVVGRVRADSVFEEGVKYVVLGHNTLRGAAGNAVLSAELLLKEGWL